MYVDTTNPKYEFEMCNTSYHIFTFRPVMMMYEGILDNCLYHCRRTNTVDYEAQTMKII